MQLYIDRKKKTSWAEQRKMPWEQSEALYHMQEPGSRKKGSKPSVTGLYDTKGGYHALSRMREIFKAENSYGNIALGVNKKKEAAFVVSQKREHNGPVTTEAQKNLHMERKKQEAAENVNLYMNPDLKQQGAFALKAKLCLPAGKVLGQMKRYHTQTGSSMLEKRMPYFCLDQERSQLKMLGEYRRKSHETGQALQVKSYDCQIQRLQNRIGKQEQAEKQMTKKLRDAWKKAKKLPFDSFTAQRPEDGGIFQEGTEDMQEQPQSEENRTGKPGNKNKSGKR